jgi:alginate O-acetyltransferase complex protein AlgI
MLLGGLWHGASWNFAVWGAYHGGLLSLERLAGRQLFQEKPLVWIYPFRAAATFILVAVGWVFFRAATFADSRYVLGQMFTRIAGPHDIRIPVWLTYMVVFSLLIALAEEKWECIERLARGPAWAYAAAVIVLVLCVELVGVTDKPIPFVYFQF